MADEVSRDEEVLEGRQGANLYPLGRALRATYHAENHHTLTNDVTGLMLDLARVPFDEDEVVPLPAVPPPPPRAGWLVRLRLLLYGPVSVRSVRR